MFAAEEVPAALGLALPRLRGGRTVVLSAQHLGGIRQTPRLREWLVAIRERLPWPAVSRLLGDPQFVSWSHLSAALFPDFPEAVRSKLPRPSLTLSELLASPPPVPDDRDLLLLSCRAQGGGCGSYSLYWAAPDVATLRELLPEPWSAEQIAHAEACEIWGLDVVVAGHITRSEGLSMERGLHAALEGVQVPGASSAHRPWRGGLCHRLPRAR